jgi:hypothetical protein
MKENPFCTSCGDWEGFILAMLPDLAYLECHRADQAKREQAASRYQGDIFRIRQVLTSFEIGIFEILYIDLQDGRGTNGGGAQKGGKGG